MSKWLAFAERKSVILPFPSSPHCVPTTTTDGISSISSRLNQLFLSVFTCGNLTHFLSYSSLYEILRELSSYLLTSNGFCLILFSCFFKRSEIGCNFYFYSVFRSVFWNLSWISYVRAIPTRETFLFEEQPIRHGRECLFYLRNPKKSGFFGGQVQLDCPFWRPLW